MDEKRKRRKIIIIFKNKTVSPVTPREEQATIPALQESEFSDYTGGKGGGGHFDALLFHFFFFRKE